MSKKPSVTQLLVAEILSAYGDCIGVRTDEELSSIEDLPYSKDAIKEALKIEFVINRHGHGQSQFPDRAQLADLYVCLAKFQPDVTDDMKHFISNAARRSRELFDIQTNQISNSGAVEELARETKEYLDHPAYRAYLAEQKVLEFEISALSHEAE